MPIYEYKCNKCQHIDEHLVKLDSRMEYQECSICGAKSSFKISTPRISLDGCSGDFPTAADRWVKLKEGKAKAEAKRDAE